MSDIGKTERLAEEVRCKEQHRTFAKSSIAWNCKNLRQVLETWGCWVQLALQVVYQNYQLNRDKHNNNNKSNNNNINHNNNNNNNK